MADLPKFIAEQVDGLQKELSSGSANAELDKLRQGEPWEAYRHGELDDILKNTPCVRAVADGTSSCSYAEPRESEER